MTSVSFIDHGNRVLGSHGNSDISVSSKCWLEQAIGTHTPQLEYTNKYDLQMYSHTRLQFLPAETQPTAVIACIHFVANLCEKHLLDFIYTQIE